MNGLGTNLATVLDRYADHRTDDLDTAITAAHDNRRGRSKQCREVLFNIVTAWRSGTTGCTDFEHGHIQQTSAGKRRKELVDLGLVELADITRPTPSGSQAKVWRPTPAGLAELSPK